MLLLANIGVKKIIFLEREKNNFNSTFKLKLVSVWVKFTSQQWALGPARSLTMTRRENGARRFPAQSCWAGLI